MAANDLASVANRMAPGAYHTTPAKIPFAAGANPAVPLRAASAAGAYLYVAVKVSASAGTLNFGDLNVADPTVNGGGFFEPTDSWQDMMLPPGCTHVRVFGAGIGTLYVWDRGS